MARRAGGNDGALCYCHGRSHENTTRMGGAPILAQTPVPFDFVRLKAEAASHGVGGSDVRLEPLLGIIERVPHCARGETGLLDEPG